MGYFSNQYALDYDREYDEANKSKKEVSKEQLVNIICKMDKALDKKELKTYSLEKIKLIKKRLDLLEYKKYEQRFSKKEKNHWYEDDYYEEDFKRI